jgi:polyisoprenoid-binding protein YceI
MKLSKLTPSIAGVLFACACLPVAAQSKVPAQQLLTAQSSIGFIARQMGVPIEGHFKKFDGQISFDTAKPASSKVAFTVEIASATLGAPETDAELPKSDWFNTAKFPHASFASAAVKPLGAGKYEVTGKLTIKGQTREVVVPVTMTQTGAVTLAVGVLPIKRLAFKIGENEWADTSMVADDVQIKFKIALSGVGKL